MSAALKNRKENVSSSVNYFSVTLVLSNCFTDSIFGRKGEKSWTPNVNIVNKHIDNVAKLEYMEFTVEVKWSRYRPGLAQRVGRGIALPFHDRGTRREWVVSSTPRPHFTPREVPVPILQEAGWASGPFWTGGKSRPHRDSIPDRPARSQSLYRLSYLAHGVDSKRSKLHAAGIYKLI